MGRHGRLPAPHASPRHAKVVSGHHQTPACRALASSTTEHAAAPPGALSPSGGGQTVKKLILLRHAESEATAGVRDHDRSISEQGKLEAASIAAVLKARGWVPDLVLASNSKRTKQTLDEMTEVISELGEVDGHFYGSLYTVAALDGQTKQHMSECLLEVVDDAKNSCVMCVGHNKGWEEAASAFTGKAIKLRTASAALLQCVTSSWREALAESANWTLVEVCSPAHATSS